MVWGWFGYPVVPDPDLPVPKGKPKYQTKCGKCKKFLSMKGLYVLSHLGPLHMDCLIAWIEKDIVRVLGERRGIADVEAARAKREEAIREIDSSQIPCGGGIYGS